MRQVLCQPAFCFTNSSEVIVFEKTIAYGRTSFWRKSLTKHKKLAKGRHWSSHGRFFSFVSFNGRRRGSLVCFWQIAHRDQSIFVLSFVIGDCASTRWYDWLF
eukprot:Lithocolla_globosa_v1_NODE_4169_length_1495_cov_13.483333.p2 type:complete len:103 gc:universal NODE_4169_length_1495_cov_13.483333:727-419(-)